MHKITVQYIDPVDSHAFEAAYRARHVPLVQRHPGLERFTISVPQGDDSPYLVAELWFADSDAVSAARASAEMAAVTADSAAYRVARRVIFAGTVEDFATVDERPQKPITLRTSDVKAADATVFVNWVSLEEDLWLAVWQQGDEHRHRDGTRAEVLSWALAQTATSYWIFSAEADDYVPLTAPS